MSTGGASAWGKPRGDGATSRVHAPAASSSASNGPPKAPPSAPSPISTASSALAPAKAQVNIAALAARNLGGFVPNKIFVGGVPVTCTEEQFRSYFEPYGAISKVELHALRGFGYVTYESVDAVDACLEKYEEHYFGKKWVEVKRSIPRELIESYEREQRRLQAEHGARGLGRGPAAGAQRAAAAGAALAKGAKAEPAAPSVAVPHTVHGPPPGAAPSRGPPRAAPWKAPGGREPPGTVMVSRIAQLKEMGFSEEVAKRVLGECVWDVNTAIDRLLASGEMPGDLSSSPGKSSPDAPQARPTWGPG
eukprot:CAMPEP_0168422288 /NCGR_PEP_ID=MMETSP0228-20121227/33718_1 /TAXON_ID=133427 /ORGANISM="Protoceratium reticulatum, Strain CCCM 535 (=CCMP 1889)" /LENGTH=305 /DNA_ID=CAMNT_0008436219 /DNA_START=46 /DNA_END=960 /DNA_ORIENTATION=+